MEYACMRCGHEITGVPCLVTAHRGTFEEITAHFCEDCHKIFLQMFWDFKHRRKMSGNTTSG
jgi:DNA-directed RNA polymerase subunit RPC12/RpoP